MSSSSNMMNNCNCKISIDSDLSTSINNKESVSIGKEKENDLSLIDTESLSNKLESICNKSIKRIELCNLAYEHIIEIILKFKEKTNIYEDNIKKANIKKDKTGKKSKISNFLNNQDIEKSIDILSDDMNLYTSTDFTENILFYSNRFPSIQLKDYIHRLIKYTKLEENEIIFMVKLIDEISNKNIIISLRNIMRILNGCLIITMKYLNDKKLSREFYCKLFQENSHSLNVIENVLLEILDYKLKRVEEDIENFKDFLYESYSCYI